MYACPPEKRRQGRHRDGRPGLTPSERDRWLLDLNLLGWSAREIGEYLGYSADSVRQMLGVLHKLYGTSDRLELAMWYLREKSNVSR